MKKFRMLHGILTIGLMLSLFGMGMETALAESRGRRIVGGTPVESGGRQGVAAVVDAGQSAYFGQFGGGTLIHPRWVVTAAQNVVTDAHGNTMAPGDMEVILGLTDLLDEGGERIGVKRIVVHPDYDTETGEADVALLELESASSRPVVSLYAGSDDLAGSTAVALGWGIAEHDSFPSILQEVEIPVVSDEAGRAGYPDLTLAEGVLFAGSDEGDKGACDFDTGGPLLTSRNGVSELAGVFSRGECGISGKYGVFTAISSVKAFIDANVGEMEQAAWFPLVVAGGGWDTNIRIANTGTGTLSGELRPFDYLGNGVSETKSFSLAEGETAEFTLSADFPQAGSVSYMAIHASRGEMDASIRLSLDGVYDADVPAVSNRENNELSIPVIKSEGEGWTGVALVNTGAVAKTLEIEFNTGENRTIDLNAGQYTAFLLRSLFDGTLRTDLTSAVIKNAGGVAGISLISGTDDVGDPALECAVLTGAVSAEAK